MLHLYELQKKIMCLFNYSYLHPFITPIDIFIDFFFKIRDEYHFIKLHVWQALKEIVICMTFTSTT